VAQVEVSGLGVSFCFSCRRQHALHMPRVLCLHHAHSGLSCGLSIMLLPSLTSLALLCTSGASEIRQRSRASAHVGIVEFTARGEQKPIMRHVHMEEQTNLSSSSVSPSSEEKPAMSASPAAGAAIELKPPARPQKECAWQEWYGKCADAAGNVGLEGAISVGFYEADKCKQKCCNAVDCTAAQVETADDSCWKETSDKITKGVDIRNLKKDVCYIKVDPATVTPAPAPAAAAAAPPALHNAAGKGPALKVVEPKAGGGESVNCTWGDWGEWNEDRCNSSSGCNTSHQRWHVRSGNGSEQNGGHACLPEDANESEDCSCPEVIHEAGGWNFWIIAGVAAAFVVVGGAGGAYYQSQQGGHKPGGAGGAAGGYGGGGGYGADYGGGYGGGGGEYGGGGW